MRSPCSPRLLPLLAIFLVVRALNVPPLPPALAPPPPLPLTPPAPPPPFATSLLLPGFACTVQDATCAALGDLYASTNGPGWVHTDGWKAAANGSFAVSGEAMALPPTPPCVFPCSSLCCERADLVAFVPAWFPRLRGKFVAHLMRPARHGH